MPPILKHKGNAHPDENPTRAENADGRNARISQVTLVRRTWARWVGQGVYRSARLPAAICNRGSASEEGARKRRNQVRKPLTARVPAPAPRARIGRTGTRARFRLPYLSIHIITNVSCGCPNVVCGSSRKIHYSTFFGRSKFEKKKCPRWESFFGLSVP